MDILGFLQQWIGLFQLPIALAGLILAGSHVWFMHQAEDNALAKRMRAVFFTDGLIYAGALLTSIWFLLEIRGPGNWLPINSIKVMALALNIWASFRLIRHFKQMGSRKDGGNSS